MQAERKNWQGSNKHGHKGVGLSKDKKNIMTKKTKSPLSKKTINITMGKDCIRGWIYLVSTAGLSSLRRAISWLIPIGLWYAGCMITLDAVKSCSVPVISDCLWAPSLHGRKDWKHKIWFSSLFLKRNKFFIAMLVQEKTRGSPKIC